jgi:hypothetical protein
VTFTSYSPSRKRALRNLCSTRRRGWPLMAIGLFLEISTHSSSLSFPRLSRGNGRMWRTTVSTRTEPRSPGSVSASEFSLWISALRALVGLKAPL